MSRKFELDKNYYEEDVEFFKKDNITINDGITVLVGCNGYGKSTLYHNIKHQLKESNIPCASFDNLTNGGHNMFSELAGNGDFSTLSNMLGSSEGENISNSIGYFLTPLREFIKTGVYREQGKFSKLAAIFDDKIEERNKLLSESSERWILFDAIDSGYSIDNIIDFKSLLNLIIEDGKNLDKDIYIVMTANSFELAYKENCLDVCSGEYIKFDNYNVYKDFVLKTRDIKNKRYEE